MLLDLNDFGNCVGEYNISLCNNIIKSIDYSCLVDDGNYFTTSAKLSKEDIFYIIETPEFVKKSLFTCAPELQTLITDKNDFLQYNYNDIDFLPDKIKDIGNNCFSIDIDRLNNVYTFIVEKDKYVVENKNFDVSIYNIKPQTNSVDFSKAIETYKLTSHGFLAHNTKDDEYTFHFSNANSYKYSNLVKNKKSINCQFMNICPTNISFNEEQFYIKYDKNNVVKSCKNDNEELCHYEFCKKENYTQYISIHPHLFDPFDPELTDVPYVYWALDVLGDDKEDEKFITRKIFKIDSSKNLMNALKSKDIIILL